MTTTSEAAKKALVIEAFDTLFNRRDYEAAVTFWSPDYIQHSAHNAPGREGLLDLVRAAPATLRSEHSLILAEGEHVMVHGQFSGIAPSTGSRLTSYVSWTGCSSSIGTCCRTRRHAWFR